MGSGTETATLEENLLQHLTAMREDVLHTIFMDLHKAYNDLDWDRQLGILEGYGVGPRTFRILRTYWAQLQMVEKSRGYFGTPLQKFCGVTQGDLFPPQFSAWWWTP